MQVSVGKRQICPGFLNFSNAGLSCRSVCARPKKMCKTDKLFARRLNYRSIQIYDEHLATFGRYFKCWPLF